MTSMRFFWTFMIAAFCLGLSACGKKGMPLAPEGDSYDFPAIYPTED